MFYILRPCSVVPYGLLTSNLFLGMLVSSKVRCPSLHYSTGTLVTLKK